MRASRKQFRLSAFAASNIDMAKISTSVSIRVHLWFFYVLALTTAKSRLPPSRAAR